jgi:hypothetical protein
LVLTHVVRSIEVQVVRNRDSINRNIDAMIDVPNPMIAVTDPSLVHRMGVGRVALNSVRTVALAPVVPSLLLTHVVRIIVAGVDRKDEWRVLHIAAMIGVRRLTVVIANIRQVHREAGLVNEHPSSVRHGENGLLVGLRLGHRIEDQAGKRARDTIVVPNPVHPGTKDRGVPVPATMTIVAHPLVHHVEKAARPT